MNIVPHYPSLRRSTLSFVWSYVVS